MKVFTSFFSSFFTNQYTICQGHFLIQALYPFIIVNVWGGTHPTSLLVFHWVWTLVSLTCKAKCRCYFAFIIDIFIISKRAESQADTPTHCVCVHPADRRGRAYLQVPSIFHGQICGGSKYFVTLNSQQQAVLFKGVISTGDEISVHFTVIVSDRFSNRRAFEAQKPNFRFKSVNQHVNRLSL